MPDFLSMTTGTGTLADPVRPLFMDLYPSIAINNCAARGPGYHRVTVPAPPAGLAADARFPPAPPGDPTTFAGLAAEMAVAVGARGATVAAAGFRVAGTDALDGTTQRTFVFALTDTFHLNVTQITVGVGAGILSFPQSIGPGADAGAGTTGHALLVPDQPMWTGFLGAYHTIRDQISGGPGTGGGGELLARIGAAQTIDDLNAITFS